MPGLGRAPSCPAQPDIEVALRDRQRRDANEALAAKRVRDQACGAGTVATLTQGVMNMSTTDHSGLDACARLLVVVDDGSWKSMK
jgi:hypothetical protein